MDRNCHVISRWGKHAYWPFWYFFVSDFEFLARRCVRTVRSSGHLGRSSKQIWRYSYSEGYFVNLSTSIFISQDINLYSCGSVMFFFFYMKLDLCILYKAVFCFLYELYLSVTGLLISFHPSIMQSLLPQLASPRLAVRKRAIIAIGECIRSKVKL